jgi:hypothetical protein
MKNSLDINWKEKGELKYKGKIAQGRNVVDLVNDVSFKRSSAGTSSLSITSFISLSKVSMTWTLCSTGGLGLTTELATTTADSRERRSTRKRNHRKLAQNAEQTQHSY